MMDRQQLVRLLCGVGILVASVSAALAGFVAQCSLEEVLVRAVFGGVASVILGVVTAMVLREISRTRRREGPQTMDMEKNPLSDKIIKGINAEAGDSTMAPDDAAKVISHMMKG